jgi:hypothetical protein
VELERLCNVTTEDESEPLANPMWPLMIARMIAMERVVMEDDDGAANANTGTEASSPAPSTSTAASSAAMYCARCGAGAAERTLLRCSRCTNGVETFYCNETCQKADWRYAVSIFRRANRLRESIGSRSKGCTSRCAARQIAASGARGCACSASSRRACRARSTRASKRSASR